MMGFNDPIIPKITIPDPLSRKLNLIFSKLKLFLESSKRYQSPLMVKKMLIIQNNFDGKVEEELEKPLSLSTSKYEF